MTVDRAASNSNIFLLPGAPRETSAERSGKTSRASISVYTSRLPTNMNGALDFRRRQLLKAEVLVRTSDWHPLNSRPGACFPSEGDRTSANKWPGRQEDTAPEAWRKLGGVPLTSRLGTLERKVGLWNRRPRAEGLVADIPIASYQTPCKW